MLDSVRVKRGKKVVFVECDLDAGETPVALKERLVVTLGESKERLRLLVEKSGGGGEGYRWVVLDDQLPMADQGVKNDHVIAVVLRREDGGWEEVDIVPFQDG
mmetsp:Transcript_16320/g.33181  ORF Transcript_16320/g.33181 Transcript_16320/m.33181 type:complete len:103 (-) Transcript_16320:2644-2952(-)